MIYAKCQLTITCYCVDTITYFSVSVSERRWSVKHQVEESPGMCFYFIYLFIFDIDYHLLCTHQPMIYDLLSLVYGVYLCSIPLGLGS